MNANLVYNDFKGTVAATISDEIGSIMGGNDLESIGRYFKINNERFKIVGLSLHGTDGFFVDIICVDKEKSTKEKEHIVCISYDINNEKNILDVLFKELQIVLYNNLDDKYPSFLSYDDHIAFSDFSEIE